MSATPNADIPPSEEGWLRRLKNILLEILNAVGDAASHLFHTLWPHVVNAWTKARNFVIAHRWRIITLVLGVILPLPVAKGFVAGILGFTATGVRAGSIAALVQAKLYGGFVPAGSIFSFLQSFGAL